MSIATDILQTIDFNTYKKINYKVAVAWYDGSAMSDFKADGQIYRKSGEVYYSIEKMDEYDCRVFDITKENLDSTTNLQRLINSINLIYGGGSIVISEEINVKGTITIPKNTTIKGKNISNPKWTDGNIIINHSPDSPNTDLFVSGEVSSGYGYLAGISISNLTIKGNSNSRYALNLFSVAHSTFSNLYIDSFEIGLYLDYMMNVSFSHVNVAEGINSLKIVGGISTTTVFDKCYFHFNSDFGVVLEHETCLGITFKDTIVESCSGGGFDIHTDNVVDFISVYTENVPRTADIINAPIIQVGINGVEKTPGYPTGTLTVVGGNLAGCNFGINDESITLNIGKVNRVSFLGTSFNRAHDFLRNTSESKLVTFNSCSFFQITDLYSLIANRRAVSFNNINRINIPYMQTEQVKASFLGTSDWSLEDEYRQTDSDLVIKRGSSYVGAINANKNLLWGTDSSTGNVTNTIKLGVGNVDFTGANYADSSYLYSKRDGNGLAHLCWRDSSGREYMDGVTSSTTAERPIYNFVGRQIFDSTLNKPIWWDGENWRDSMANIV